MMLAYNLAGNGAEQGYHGSDFDDSQGQLILASGISIEYPDGGEVRFCV